MKHLNRCVSVRLLGLIGVLATSACSTTGGARAPETSPAEKQTSIGTGVPTMSLEAVAINGKSLGDDPKPQINASPGDIITAEVCIRDWSPNDEPLSGYQAALLPASFSSGKGGLIEPVQYAALQKAGSPNPANSFIDDDHPRFVHSGLKTLSLADAASKGYRWVGLVLRGIPPKCAQTGKRFYAATVKFEVSADAQGTFSLELDSDPDYSGLRSAGTTPTQGVKFEPLTIKILSE